MKREQISNSAGQNASINTLKGISCLVVVWLHCRFPGLIGDAIIYSFRFSLPIFFMVSGYYSYSKNDTWIISKMKQILKILICAEIFYGVWDVIQECVIHKNSLQMYVSEFFLNLHPIKVIFFGTLFNNVLWYLYAVFWAWAIFLLLRRSGKMQKSYCLILPLLVAHICGRYIFQNHFEFGENQVFWFRSTLLFALPMMLIGEFFAEKSVIISEKLTEIHALLLTVTGVGLLIGEYFYSGQYMDLHFSTVFIASGMFLYAQVRPDIGEKYGLRPFTYIGKNLYMYVYLYHSFIGSLADMAEKTFGFERLQIWIWGKPIFVAFCAVCAAQFWIWMKCWWKKSFCS